jgi:hypothetical protein
MMRSGIKIIVRLRNRKVHCGAQGDKQFDGLWE